MKITLLFIILAFSLIISTMCYEFYTTTKINRFKFRHWFAIGMLNAFTVSLALYFEVSGDAHFQNVRWATFAMMEVLFLEIFINQYTFRHRRNELLVRTVYYWAVLLSPVIMYAPLNILISIIISYLAFTGDRVIGSWFGWSFVLYGMTTVIPEMFGYGTIASFLIGNIFTIHLFIGVYKLYRMEIDKEVHGGH
jgi:hypothetical protein